MLINVQYCLEGDSINTFKSDCESKFFCKNEKQ